VKKEQHNGGWEIPETDTYANQLLGFNPLREPTIRSAIAALQLPPGSRGLDAGCGIGSHTALLAEAIGPDGHVTGLDVSPGFLVYAREMAARVGLSERISFQEGDVRELPFVDDTFDWVWSVDCVGYAPQVPPPRIRELTRVTKPGGRVAIMAWSSQHLLPGYPLLEARLNATAAGIAPFTAGMRPERHFLRALGWLRDVGLKDATARTFLGDVCAPLSEEVRAALMSLLDMRWGGAESEVTPEDWAAYQRLCQPESPDFILDLPDYYAFFTYTLFHGQVAG
jgi:ubiquinone/menaquinone biosynthesis C-methylase UbiE